MLRWDGPFKQVISRHPAVAGQVYLDDFLFTAPSPADLTPIPDLLRSWGLAINESKSCLTPSQQLTYLGIEVNLHNMTLGVPEALQTRMLRAISLAPSLSPHAARRLAG